MANIPRHPIYVKYWPPRWTSPSQDFYRNIIISAPVVITQPQNRQSDWPLAKGWNWWLYRQSTLSQPLGSPRILILEHCAFQFAAFQTDGFQVCQPPFALYDWPKPTLTPFVPQPTFWAFDTPLPLLASSLVAAPPPFPAAWPPPPLRPFTPPSLNYLAGSLPLPLGAPPTPPFGTSWPLPPSRPFVPPSLNYLAGSLPLPLGAAVPFNLEDWPAPRPPYRVYADSYSTNFQLLTSVQPPTALEDWPLPIQPPRVYAQSYSTALALLQPPTAPPINLEDWPLPTQPYRIYAEVRRAHLDLLQSVQPPNAQSDWPIPRPPYRVYADSYSTNFQLLTSVQPPISQSQWPPPVQPYRISAQSYSTPLTLLSFTPAAAPPINLEDWPVPTRPYLVYADVRRADIQLLHSVQPPISQSDWPVPKRVPPFFYSQNYGSYALQLAKPFGQSDWPGPIQPYRVYAEVRRADISLLHSVQPPIAQLSWPVPTQPYRVYSQSQPTPTSALTPATPPIAQYDWPLPTQPGRVYAAQFRAPIGLLHSVQPPNRQSDWPLPKLSREVGKFAKREGFPQLVRASTPFAQLDWPNPKLPIQPTTAKTWIQRASLALQQLPPIAQRDWPNPWLGQTTKVRSQSYSSPTALLKTPVTKPFKLDLWPVSLFYQYLHLYYSPEAWQGIGHGQAHITPPPIVPPQPAIIPKYESQVGVWHPKAGVHGRTGKRYRIYPPPQPVTYSPYRADTTIFSADDSIMSTDKE